MKHPSIKTVRLLGASALFCASYTPTLVFAQDASSRRIEEVIISA